MSELSVYFNSINTTPCSESNSSAGMHSQNSSSSVWGSNIIKDKPKKTKESEAKKAGYENTVNADIYYDKSKKMYVKWMKDLNKFYPLYDVEEVYKNGAYKKKGGMLVSSKGEYSYTGKKGERIYKTNYGSKMKNDAQIIGYLCDVKGYTSTRRSGIYYDKENNSYLQWNSETKDFVPSAIEDVNQYGGYKKEGKYYSSSGKELGEKEYKAIKSNLGETDNADIYLNYSSKVYYKWNESSRNFEKFDPNAEKNAFLSSNPDGEIGDFKQGNQGDCWLLASLKAVSSHEEGKKLIKESIKTDENGNVTITLKGPQKSYTITKEELDKACKEQEYSFGDKDVVAIEMAMERFRTENTTGKFSRNPYSLDYVGPHYENMLLHGGDTRNALEVLTGKGAVKIQRTREENLISIDNKIDAGKFDEQNLKKYLDNKDNIIVASLYNDNDSGYRVTGHAFQFAYYDEENVYLINPHDTAQKALPMKKEEFYKKLINISVTDLKSRIDTKRANATFVKSVNTPEAEKYLAAKKKVQNR